MPNMNLAKNFSGMLAKRLNGHRTTDAYLIGYPKAGNTWLLIMLGKYVQLLSGRNENLPFPTFDAFDFWGRCIRWDPRLPRIQFSHGALEWTWQTTADLSLRNLVLPYRRKKVILLVRNIPDVLVSLYWQHKTQVKPPYEGDISQFIRDPVLGVEKAVAFYRLWAEGQRFIPSFLLLRYEDLIQDPYGHFYQLLAFWKIPVNQDYLSQAVEYGRFENMRQLELKNLKTHSLTYRSGLPIFATGDVQETSEAFHVRKGKIGGYREYLSAPDIEFLHEAMHGKIPEVYGYLDGFWDEGGVL